MKKRLENQERKIPVIRYADARHLFLNLSSKYPDIIKDLNVRSVEIDAPDCFILTLRNPSSAMFFELANKNDDQIIRLYTLCIDPISLSTKEYKNLGSLVYHNFRKHKR
jgi:hypothetical protein